MSSIWNVNPVIASVWREGSGRERVSRGPRGGGEREKDLPLRTEKERKGGIGGEGGRSRGNKGIGEGGGRRGEGEGGESPAQVTIPNPDSGTLIRRC